MITVVVADDHPIVRQGLWALLSLERDLRMVGEAGDGAEALRLTSALEPDVLVLDLGMGGIGGLEVARQVGKGSPRTKVVVLSMYDSEAYVHEALSAGAKAYVVKGSAPNEIVSAIRKAAAGSRYLSSPLSEESLKLYEQKLGTSELGMSG